MPRRYQMDHCLDHVRHGFQLEGRDTLKGRQRPQEQQAFLYADSVEIMQDGLEVVACHCQEFRPGGEHNNSR